MTITFPEEITYSDTEYVIIRVPDNVLEFLQECESGDRLVEVEAFVSGVSLGRIGKRTPATNPIQCRFRWDITISGWLERTFRCWLDGQEISPAYFNDPTPTALAPRDILYLNLTIPL